TVVVTVALVLLALAIVQSGAWGWSSTRTVGALLGAVVLLGAFAGRCATVPNPVLPLDLFSERGFRWANLGQLLYGTGFTIMFFGNVQFLREVWGYSPVWTGLAMAPGPLVVFLLAPPFGRLAGRIGQRPILIPGGGISAAAALFLLSRVDSAGRFGDARGRARSSPYRAPTDGIEAFTDRRRRTSNDAQPSGAPGGLFMTETIVLLHGGATGSSSWNPVARSLATSGASVFAPDMLGYGASPAPTGSYAIAEEVAHLIRGLGLQPRSCNGMIYAVGFGGTFHLVTHSLGSLIGLHLRRALGARVARMTLVDPVLVSVLREYGEDDAYAEME